MVEFLAPAGDRPVSGTLLVTGEGTYRENAADANGVMQSNVQRRAEVEGVPLGHRLRAHRGVSPTPSATRTAAPTAGLRARLADPRRGGPATPLGLLKPG
jgi:hypothetical protein